MSDSYIELGRRSGSAQKIVKLLKDYNRPVPQDFVAYMLGWNTADVAEQLESMEQVGLVKRDGDEVEVVWQAD
jgi:DNA-binding IclR family transcriptional regulator